jgi:hypothetical protein
MVRVDDCDVSEGDCTKMPMADRGGVLAGRWWCVMNTVDRVIRWSTALAVLGVGRAVRVTMRQVRASAPAPLAAAPFGYPAAGLRGQTGLPSAMSLGRTRGAVLQESIFAGAGGSPVQSW